ncbi:MAG: glycoside hydrolase family 36 protein [Actinomycetes bacterium]
MRPDEDGFAWAVVNGGSDPVTVRSVSVVHTVRDVSGELRMFRNGYQSWSHTGMALPGRSTDPSLTDGALDLLLMSHFADQRPATGTAVRSELVTLLADDHGAVLVGALGGDRHDTTFRMGSGRSGLEMSVEAFLGDVELGPGTSMDLHDVVVRRTDDPSAALDAWAGECGRRSGARVDAPYRLGWCSWYHYFEHITERTFLAEVSRSADWPFDVLQLDDGFQSAIGDWTITDSTFPNGLAAVADAVVAGGRQAGLWLAPFLAAPESKLARAHPDWIARFPGTSEPLIGMHNDHWGGFVYALDTSHPEVQEHLEQLGRDLVQMGFTYLKLDFTYAPGFDGVWFDRSLTPAQRIRAGYDAIRRGVGDDTFLLGCGAPQGACIGVVDGMRVGPDVAPWWSPKPELWPYPGFEGTIPSTANAWRSTLARSFQHRRLWLNDPDCLMLRSTETDLTDEQIRTWALAVGMSGGMAVVSDDLSMLDDRASDLLVEVLALGRAADDAARTGPAPRCEDLMTAEVPTTLTAVGRALRADPASGAATLDEA